MSERIALRLSWAVCGVSVVMVGAALLLTYVNRSTPQQIDFGTQGGVVVALVVHLAFPIVGALIASRRPENAIGWLCLACGMGIGLSPLATEYASYALATDPGGPPGGLVALWLANWVWVPTIGVIATFFVLLFPDGRLPSPRWRAVGWASGVVIVALTLTLAFAPGRLENSSTPNPFGIDAASTFFDYLSATIILLPLCFVGAVTALTGRFIGSRGQQRQQLKWFVSAGGLVAGIYLIQMIVSVATGSIVEPSDTTAVQRSLQDAAYVSFAAIPAATAIAVFRYRLYDIDVIINRTLVYGALSILLALVYVAGVVGFGGALRSLAGQQDNGLAVAASTLAVAALFRPSRSRIQSFIDRRFYRRKYDATRTLEVFGASLRDEVDLDALIAGLVSVVQGTVQPAHVSVWMRTDER